MKKQVLLALIIVSVFFISGGCLGASSGENAGDLVEESSKLSKKELYKAQAVCKEECEAEIGGTTDYCTQKNEWCKSKCPGGMIYEDLNECPKDDFKNNCYALAWSNCFNYDENPSSYCEYKCSEKYFPGEWDESYTQGNKEEIKAFYNKYYEQGDFYKRYAEEGYAYRAKEAYS